MCVCFNVPHTALLLRPSLSGVLFSIIHWLIAFVVFIDPYCWGVLSFNIPRCGFTVCISVVRALLAVGVGRIS